jgi:hypothetical protein
VALERRIAPRLCNFAATTDGYRGNCGSSQNGRGGLSFVVEDAARTSSITALIDGDTAPTKGP